MVAGTLARYYAAKAVRAQLRSHKIKIAEVNAGDIRRMADAYLTEHLSELLAQAERTIAASPVLQAWWLYRKRPSNIERNCQRDQCALVAQTSIQQTVHCRTGER